MHRLLTGLCLAGLLAAATLPTAAAPGHSVGSREGDPLNSVGPVVSRSHGRNTISGPAITDAFFRTVFGLEYGGRQADAFRVKRFAGAVRFYVEDLSSARKADKATEFLRSLPRHIAHLKGTVVDRREDANFRVILVDAAEFSAVVQAELKADALAMNARCLVGVSTFSGRIERSTAVIVADDDFLFNRCLVEEVLQGLGPMNDDASLSESVFNDTSRHSRFTEFDAALMNVLYHPLIRPGMSGTEVHQALPQVLNELGYNR